MLYTKYILQKKLFIVYRRKIESKLANIATETLFPSHVSRRYVGKPGNIVF